MGKTGSKLTRALGLNEEQPSNIANNSRAPASSNAPQWDATVDRLFGDVPAEDNVNPSSLRSDTSLKSRRRRRAPPPPPPFASPSTLNRNRRHRQSITGTKNRRNPCSMKTPIVPDTPRRVATGRARAMNAPFDINRRPIVVPTPNSGRERSSRTIVSNGLKRRPSSRRRKLPSQRTLRLQELLQCPVCLTPYSEPRLLPCGHTYCDECLNRLMQNNNDIVTCPECRKQHLVPEDGVFPPNFVVRNLLDEQGMSTNSRLLTPSNLSFTGGTTAKCTTCEILAPLRLCRHCNFMVCDRCLRAHRIDSNNQEDTHKTSLKMARGKLIQFYVAVRKITSSESQVKRLTIDMPIGNYLHDTCETLIQRVAEREQLQSIMDKLVLEFGDKRLRPQRTLASYGVQNGDLLFLFNPEQRLNFLAYDNDEDLPGTLSLPNREKSRFRKDSFNSSLSDIRTATSNEMNYNRMNHPLSTILDHDSYASSSFSDN